MAELNVTPEYLEKLAKKQDDASSTAKDAAGAASAISTAVWVTHGVISGPSNGAITSAEKMRRAAGKNISAAANDLAAKLRTAGDVYGNVDEELGANLNKQILDR